MELSKLINNFKSAVSATKGTRKQKSSSITEKLIHALGLLDLLTLSGSSSISS